MAARIIKIAGLLVLAAALCAPLASAKPWVDTADNGFPAVPASRYLNTPAQDQGMQAPAQATSQYLNTPAQDQGMQATVVAPNDKAGTLGIGQTSPNTIGMGGQYGENLIQNSQAQKKRDLQAATRFALPLAPDDRPGTATAATPALVIPYLSHGIGVNAAQFSGTPVRPDDRAGVRPSVPSMVPTAFGPVSTTGNGSDWGIVGFGAAGLAAIALAIGLLVVLGRRSRHEGVAVS